MKAGLKAVLLLVTLALASCAVTPTHIPEYREVFIGPSAKNYIQTTALLQGRTEGNLLRVAYDGTSLYDREIKYRFTWFDASGFELPGITGNWLVHRVQGQQPFRIQSIATNQKAVSFRLLIYDRHAQVIETANK